MYPEQTSVHRVRFFTPDNLKGIHCMSIDEENRKLAIGRRGVGEESGSSLIEIWDINFSPCIDQKLFENDEEPILVESICWGFNSRLFSSGSDGNINEFDLMKGCIKHRRDINAGPVWCLAIDPTRTRLVSGSEDGTISTTDIAENGFGEIRRVGKMSHRVLSLAWMEFGDKIVAGSQGVIAIYDSKSRRQIEKIQLDGDTLVWSLATFKNSIISGDSKGKTSFWRSSWNGDHVQDHHVQDHHVQDHHVLEKRHHSHQSAVLTVSVSKKGIVYSAGVDPLIAQFDALSTKSLPPVHAHTHDVTSVLVDDSGAIFSGGKDVHLVRTFISPKKITKFSPHLTDCVKFWENVLSLQYSKAIELYLLDTKSVSESVSNSESGRNVSSSESEKDVSKNVSKSVSSPEKKETPLPTKLMRIRSKWKIVSSAISATWVAYSGYKDVVFINLEGEEVSKVRHSLVFGDEVTVDKMSFLDNKTLALSSSTKVRLISLSFDSVTELALKQFDHRIVSLSSSPQSIAVVLSNKELIYMPKGDWTPISVSKVASIPTTMGFNPHEWNKLYICTSRKTLVEFNLKKDELREEKSTSLIRFESDHFFRGMAFKPDSILLYTNSALCSLDLASFSLKARLSQYKSIIAVHSIHGQNQKQDQKKGQNQNRDQKKGQNQNRDQKKGQNPPSQIVLVELPEEQFIRSLPPAFMKRIFGAE